MHLTINRHKMDSSGTLSTVCVKGETFWGIERPWIGNRPEISCIPGGDYALIQHQSGRFGDVWAFVGGTVSYMPHPQADRYACLIHVANYGDEVKGCLGLGTHAGETNDGRLAVWNSRVAVDKLREIAGDKLHHTATVRWFDSA
tara:strand:+ start:105 stop:536 length:432 start_codon:yes stop_codon:yes gene_type:complete